MDWIRRNWPDLLIGIALLAVIGGIIATLLNGGSFFAPTSSPPAVASPQPTPPAPASSTVNTTPPAPQPPQPPSTDASIPIIPSLGDESDEADAIVPAPPEPVATTPQPQPPQPPAAPASQPAPAPQPQPPAPQQPATLPFRISVGSFSVPENAERRAAEFRAAGYPVFIAPQGNLSIVLVGPYATRAEAEQVRDAIVSAGLETSPQIFEFTGQPTVQQASAAPAPAPTAGDGRFIQVGAYASSQSAQPQRQRLEALGFAVSELQEGSLIKLVIGPFATEDIAEVRSRLRDQGIDHFVR